MNTIEEVINNPQFAYRGIWSEYNDFHFAGLPAVINSQNFSTLFRFNTRNIRVLKVRIMLYHFDKLIQRIYNQKYTHS